VRNEDIARKNVAPRSRNRGRRLQDRCRTSVRGPSTGSGRMEHRAPFEKSENCETKPILKSVSCCALGACENWTLGSFGQNDGENDVEGHRRNPFERRVRRKRSRERQTNPTCVSGRAGRWRGWGSCGSVRGVSKRTGVSQVSTAGRSAEFPHRGEQPFGARDRHRAAVFADGGGEVVP